MTRKLVAVFAVRAQSTRLYAKPLQNICVHDGITIISHLVRAFGSLPFVSQTVLAIAEGDQNAVFVEHAKALGVPYIRGSEADVLSRHIDAGAACAATDVLRVSSESPFPYLDGLPEIWSSHVENGWEASFLDNLIDGVGYEIMTQSALKKSRALTDDPFHLEHCSQFIRQNNTVFKARQVDGPSNLDRRDIRLTVDYPEDLVVCRQAYEALKSQAPTISPAHVVEFLDKRPDLLSLIAPLTEAGYASMFKWGPDGEEL